jgi:hypothetical protein
VDLAGLVGLRDADQPDHNRSQLELVQSAGHALHRALRRRHPPGATLTDHLLTQVEQADALSLAPVTAQPRSGLVVSGADALKVIEYLKGRRYPAALLADRQRYKGKRRKLASQPFDPDWISRQRHLGLPAIIPDAWYVAERDLMGLRLVLQRSAEIPGAVALLPLANWWMYEFAPADAGPGAGDVHDEVNVAAGQKRGALS